MQREVNDDLLREQDRAFCISVKVPIEKLTLNGSHSIDRRTVENLVKHFKSRTFDRLDPRSHLPALITPNSLPQYLYDHANDNLQDPPVFDPVDVITCLRGGDQLEAAKICYASTGGWWLIDLYRDDLSLELRAALRDNLRSARLLSDGDIFLRIRTAHLRRDSLNKREWLQKIGKDDRECILSLERDARRDDTLMPFSDALDALIPFRGLWSAFQVDQLPALRAQRCLEEMTRYLLRTRATWQLIVGTTYSHVDVHTVQTLQGRCPSGSTEDRRHIETQMKEGRIFPGVESRSGRSQLLKNIATVPYTITSFHTLFEDVKCLEPCSSLLRDMIPPDLRGSISQSMDRIHNGQTKFRYELADGSFAFKVEKSSSVARWKAYRSLWLFALRRVLVAKSQRPWVDRKIALAHAQDARLWRSRMDLAQFAVDCGYSVLHRASESLGFVDELAVNDFLRDVRPSELYHSGCHELSDQVKSICAIVQTIEPRKPSTRSPLRSSESNDLGAYYGIDRLFYSHVYDGTVRAGPGRHLTSYGHWRDFFYRFFGTPDDVPQPSREATPEDNMTEAETSPGSPEVSLAEEHSLGREFALANDSCVDQNSAPPRKRQKINHGMTD